MGHVCDKRYGYTKQKHPRCKKGEAKSEAPKVTMFIYSTKKIDIMQVEAKAYITERDPNNLSYIIM